MRFFLMNLRKSSSIPAAICFCIFFLWIFIRSSTLTSMQLPPTDDGHPAGPVPPQIPGSLLDGQKHRKIFQVSTNVTNSSIWNSNSSSIARHNLSHIQDGVPVKGKKGHGATETQDCIDNAEQCDEVARLCDKNPDLAHNYCRKSCDLCGFVP